nr:ATP-binding protein [Novosphingobium sp. B-7]
MYVYVSPDCRSDAKHQPRESSPFSRAAGIGKSHLATAIEVAAVKAGRSVYRCSLAGLIEALTKAEREGRLVEKSASTPARRC